MKKALMITQLAALMGTALSGPSTSILGGPMGHMPKFDGDDPVAPIMAELKRIETGLVQKQDARLEEIKAGLKVPDQDPKIKQLEADHAQLKADLQGLQAKANRLDFTGAAGERKSAGEQFLEGVELKNRARQFNMSVELKALTNTTIGVVPDAQRLPFQETPTEPHIRDLLPSGETSNSTLKFPQRKIASDVNGAAMVAEGGLKPESSFAFEMVTTEVKKIAHWMKISDELLEDQPALRSYIDAQLIDGLRDVEDAQILKGDGTGQNLLGLYTVASAYNRAVAGDTLLDTLLRAKTQLRLVNRTATGIVLNPEDWETIQLLKGSDSHYIWANIPDANGQRVWALPVRDSTKLSEGEWLVGDFRRGAQLFDRRQAAITMANQNEDDFKRNLVLILAEERLGLVIYDRLAFIKNAPA